MINRGYKSNHKIAGNTKTADTKGIPCDNCKAWKDSGTEYYKCAVPGYCPALETDTDKGLILYTKMVLEASEIQTQFDKQIKG